MFKMVFGREDNIKFPCYLLSYLIDMSYEELLDKLKFTKNETGKEKQNNLSYRNDLVLDINGIIINVEMNNNNTEEIRNRNISYLMRLREDRISDWTLSDDLRESCDKEWALKDQALRDGYLDGFNEGKEDGLKEGREQGIQQGIEQGRKQGIEIREIELVKNMLINNMSVEEIAKITDISIERIIQIKEM